MMKYIVELSLFIFLLSSCGDHSTKSTEQPSGQNPVIIVTNGPYEVIENKITNIGIQTDFASEKPNYIVLPKPIGFATGIINEDANGSILEITGIKAGNTTFSITDASNSAAPEILLNVTVLAKPSLEIFPNPFEAKIDETLLISVTTKNNVSEPIYKVTVADTAIATSSATNPLLLTIHKAGQTEVKIEDLANDISETVDLTANN